MMSEATPLLLRESNEKWDYIRNILHNFHSLRCIFPVNDLNTFRKLNVDQYVCRCMHEKRDEIGNNFIEDVVIKFRLLSSVEGINEREVSSLNHAIL
jgi:hypothetical protein